MTFRRKDGFEAVKTLVVDDVAGDVMIRSPDNAVAAAQAIMTKVAPQSRCLSDEIIADRRAEAQVTEPYARDSQQ